MKLTKILIGVAAAAFLCGCSSQQVSDESTTTEAKEGTCCASGSKEGKSCCSTTEAAPGQCSEKKSECTAGKSECTEKKTEQKN